MKMSINEDADEWKHLWIWYEMKMPMKKDRCKEMKMLMNEDAN